MPQPLPDIGLWRVDRTQTIGPQDERKEVRNFLGSTGVPNTSKFELIDHQDLAAIQARYELTNPSSEGYELSSEKGKVKSLEGAGILEAMANVFGACVAKWSNCNPPKRPARAPAYISSNDFDYYLDVYPIDVKTASGIYSNTSENKKLLIKQQLINTDPSSKYQAKQAKIAQEIAGLKPKQIRALEEDLPGSLSDLTDGVYGSVNAVVGKLNSKALLLYGYPESSAKTSMLAGINKDEVAQRFKVKPDDLDTLKVIPYIVVDTGFLSEKHRTKFWTLLNQRVSDAALLRHVIEVQSCTHDAILGGRGYKIVYRSS